MVKSSDSYPIYAQEKTVYGMESLSGQFFLTENDFKDGKNKYL